MHGGIRLTTTDHRQTRDQAATSELPTDRPTDARGRAVNNALPSSVPIIVPAARRPTTAAADTGRPLVDVP